MQSVFSLPVFVAALVIYSGEVVLCLMFGQGMLPMSRLLARWVGASMMLASQCGGVIETTLYPHLAANEKHLRKLYARGILLYLIPAGLAYGINVESRQLLLSAVLYVLLMVRVAWRVAAIRKSGWQPHMGAETDDG